ncbi:hypothetical protein BBJ29_007950 [Phytophthora kernoviae]|uniref:WRKY19-like zinc finger domain-containing protein n=1 Tax=Phytophthora kernoviae TaxID=325452 RepID=A0A3F2RTR0_9STRA|nr:hypothetical protein BBJ29_007950 [Phytophthora kernoviae]RLN63033.1 hypothetical protein BBP00_00004359 [Phytophthora kernoviae]
MLGPRRIEQQLQPDAVKRQLLNSSSVSINLATTSMVVSTPLLPSIGSISPANTTTATRFPVVVGGNNLLTPLRLEYCRFQGCPNFGKMQGYCHDHIQGRPAPHQLQLQTSPQNTFSQCTGPLPSLVLPSPVQSQPQPQVQPPSQFLPALSSVVPTRTRQSVSVSVYPTYDMTQPTSPMYPESMSSYKRPPIFTENATFMSTPLNKKPRVLASPTPSTGSTNSSKPAAKCRRDGCMNDARRKGLCMEHGGRHFCKMVGCQKCAHRGGFCISHGGGRRCAVASCSKSAQSGGICYSHGGGKRCATEGCTHAARSGGYCIKHGKQVQQLQQQQQN